MSYTFAGQLFGLLCADCSEPVANTTIRMYRSRRSVAPSASEGELLALTDDAVQARSGELLAEVESDEHGAFTVQLDDERYHGEPFEIHACPTVPLALPLPSADERIGASSPALPRWMSTGRFWALSGASSGRSVLCGRWG